MTGVSSGFSELDAVTAGFQPGNLIILAARPSMGKSALGISIAANVVRSGTPCAFFTLEMSKQEVTQRLICLEGKIDSHKIRTGKLAEEDWSRLSKACASSSRCRSTSTTHLASPSSSSARGPDAEAARARTWG